MNIKDVASHFNIALLHPPGDEGIHLQSEIARGGFKVDLYTDEESCVRGLEKHRHHVLVLFTPSLKHSLSDVVERLLKINSELKWIAVTTSGQFDILAQYRNYGCTDVVVSDVGSLEARIRWAAERACESLYQQYQNEQLFADLKKANSGQIPSSLPISGPLSLTAVFKAYALTTTPEQVLGSYLQNSPRAGIFLRYVDATKSFIVQAVSATAEAAQGLGFQFENKLASDLFSEIKNGQTPETLKALCERNLGWKKIVVFCVEKTGSLEGLTVHPVETDADLVLLSDYFQVFDLVLENRTLGDKVQRNTFVDPQTDLFNFTYYTTKLKEEIERARRLQKPLSLVKLAVDDFIEIEQSLGENTRDHLIRTLADKIRQSGRSLDINSRTKTNEFALLLPHSSKKGALVRAERLRRSIESQSLSEYGVKISISLGISEFPTLATSGENLDLSATQALNHIMEKGGNKIAVFRPSETHRPEFIVNEEEP